MYNVNLTFATTCQTECHEGAYHPKYLMSEHSVKFACVWIKLDEFKQLSSGYDDLLLLGAGKVAMDGLHDACCSLQGQRVQEHVDRLTHSVVTNSEN